jgi:hypothetical protein
MPVILDEEARRAAVKAALGRMFRMMMRPYQEGDVAEYEKCRGVVLDCSPEPEEDHSPNWVLHRRMGAAGD